MTINTLIIRWRESAEFWREKETEYGAASAISISDCADELAPIAEQIFSAIRDAIESLENGEAGHAERTLRDLISTHPTA